MNFNELAESLELEEHEFLEMVELFVETSDSDLNKLKCAIDEGNMQEVAIAAHSIKGASGTLGFMEAHEAAKEIEEGARSGRAEGLAEFAQELEQELDTIAEIARG